MKNEDLRRRFLRLSTLNILSNITVPLAGLVDVAVLGRAPRPEVLAGCALAGVIFNFIYWGFGFLRMATTGLVARARGAGEDREAESVLIRSSVLALVAGLAILILQWPLRELGFLLSAGEPGVHEMGRAYFDARIYGAPAALLNYAFLGYFLGREQSGRALVMAVVANLCNIALSWLFVVEWNWGASGAGASTAISQYAQLFAALVFRWRDRRTQIPLVSALNWDAFRQLFALNRDIFVRTLFLITVFALFTNFSARLGTLELAANSILLALLNVASYAIDGAAHATETLAGRFHGAGNRGALRRTLALACRITAGFALVFLLGLAIQREWTLSLLNHDPAVVQRSAELFWWLIPTVCLGAVAYILDGFFIGVTAGSLLRRGMVRSALLGFFPVALVSLSLESGELLWLALILFMAARILTLKPGLRTYLDESS